MKYVTELRGVRNDQIIIVPFFWSMYINIRIITDLQKPVSSSPRLASASTAYYSPLFVANLKNLFIEVREILKFFNYKSENGSLVRLTGFRLTKFA